MLPGDLVASQKTFVKAESKVSIKGQPAVSVSHASVELLYVELEDGTVCGRDDAGIVARTRAGWEEVDVEKRRLTSLYETRGGSRLPRLAGGTPATEVALALGVRRFRETGAPLKV